MGTSQKPRRAKNIPGGDNCRTPVVAGRDRTHAPRLASLGRDAVARRTSGSARRIGGEAVAASAKQLIRRSYKL